uniref:Integrase_H2C2 domain-containing protein n=1 Tax=Loa loa TaxID=7209 RepID=A0A1I7V8F1_LOALO
MVKGPEMGDKWTRLIRTTAWALKFLNLISKQRIPWLNTLSGKNRLNNDDYELAIYVFIRQAQSEGITEEGIIKWNLYYEKGVRKSKSRLEYAELDKQSLHPIYLPRYNCITEIFIQQQHEEMFHAGTAHTISSLRKRFWIPKGRTEAKRVLNKWDVNDRRQNHLNYQPCLIIQQLEHDEHEHSQVLDWII